MSLGHVGLATGPGSHEEMRAFYVAALAPLGYRVYLEQAGQFVGLGGAAGPDFWLHRGDDEVEPARAGGRAHVAFAVGGRSQVDQWYRNAV